ncbi:hypothetical protein PLESTB_001235600 [Pleodorina starrii]|uniref:Uncharacterized protein n=1 Tax=Pleodorina starrii TaxID=330485 RepID=A0A9W6BT03_9CHLO|nr:hypothetical protein PLESTM_000224200 [Pleodorina starrii]GLC57513.1 hypothetical protein PLESTB_001235600 [Pleodorina starrii]GLC63185.1 hypothetical protein PLESTF_000009600 [Pleodorina starrii]
MFGPEHLAQTNMEPKASVSDACMAEEVMIMEDLHKAMRARLQCSAGQQFELPHLEAIRRPILDNHSDDELADIQRMYRWFADVVYAPRGMAPPPMSALQSAAVEVPAVPDSSASCCASCCASSSSSSSSPSSLSSSSPSSPPSPYYRASPAVEAELAPTAAFSRTASASTSSSSAATTAPQQQPQWQWTGCSWYESMNAFVASTSNSASTTSSPATAVSVLPDDPITVLWRQIEDIEAVTRAKQGDEEDAASSRYGDFGGRPHVSPPLFPSDATMGERLEVLESLSRRRNSAATTTTTTTSPTAPLPPSMEQDRRIMDMWKYIVDTQDHTDAMLAEIEAMDAASLAHCSGATTAGVEVLEGFVFGDSLDCEEACSSIPTTTAAPEEPSTPSNLPTEEEEAEVEAVEVEAVEVEEAEVEEAEVAGVAAVMEVEEMQVAEMQVEVAEVTEVAVVEAVVAEVEAEAEQEQEQSRQQRPKCPVRLVCCSDPCPSYLLSTVSSVAKRKGCTARST